MATSLPEDQMQLALEDAKQEAVSDQARSEQRNPAEGKVSAVRRRANRGKLPAHLLRIIRTLCGDSAGFSADGQPRVGCNHLTNAEPDNRMIVDDEDSRGGQAH